MGGHFGCPQFLVCEHPKRPSVRMAANQGITWGAMVKLLAMQIRAVRVDFCPRHLFCIISAIAADHFCLRSL